MKPIKSNPEKLKSISLLGGEEDNDYNGARKLPFELHLSSGTEDTLIVEEFDISVGEAQDHNETLGPLAITAPGIYFRRINNEVFKKINEHYGFGIRLFKLNTKNKIPFIRGQRLNFTYDLTADVGSTMTVEGTVGLEYRRISLEGSRSYNREWGFNKDNRIRSQHKGVALNYMATKKFSVSGYMEDAKFDYKTTKGNADIENPTAGIKVQYLFD